MGKTIRVAAVMEAYTVTGPAKNLIRFGKLARQAEAETGTAVEMHVVTYVRGEQARSNAFLSALAGAGIAAHPIVERGALDRQVIGALRGELAAIQPDLVQTHSVKSHFLFRCAGLERVYPWIAFHHGYTQENLKVRLYNELDRWSLRGARQLVTVCTPFAGELQERGVRRERIEVLGNSIESPAGLSTGAVARIAGVPDGAPVILHIGRFSGEKNHAGLMDAFAAVCAQAPGLKPHLVLVGDGVDRERMQLRAGELAAGGQIHFEGQQADVWPYLRRAQVFALPSLSEGSPNVILEAMAAGLPIVASRVGGIPDMAPEGEAALLCTVGNTQELAAALGQLLTDPELAQRLGRQARQRVEQYTPENYRRRMLGIYANVLGG